MSWQKLTDTRRLRGGAITVLVLLTLGVVFVLGGAGGPMMARLTQAPEQLRQELPVRAMPASYLCGPDALSHILRKWGDPVSTERLAELAGTSESEGTSLQGLRQAAQARGVIGAGAALDYAALKKQVASKGAEVIAHVEPSHYYWVRYVSDSGVAVQDESSPATRWFPREEFEAMWTGRALLLMRPATNRWSG